jgi:hypothetical protein
MATISDATFSVYTFVNDFAKARGFKFVSTTDIEEATNRLQDHEDKIILVQNKIEYDVFIKLEYYLFVSLAERSDINSILYTKVLSDFLGVLPKYSKICIYDSDGLLEVPSRFDDTGKRLVVSNIHQRITSITQMKNNLSAVVFNLTGYIE